MILQHSECVEGNDLSGLNEPGAPRIYDLGGNRAGKVLSRLRRAPSGSGTARSNGVPANACGRVADQQRAVKSWDFVQLEFA
jgi:hypothetical protein